MLLLHRVRRTLLSVWCARGKWDKKREGEREKEREGQRERESVCICV